MKDKIKDAIVNAEGRALATTGPYGLNVIPISVAKVFDDKIHLYNFFMKKTVENIQTDKNVAFSFWTGLAGAQIRATAEYITEGEEFDKALVWAKAEYPDRTLSGIIILTPMEGYSISALDQPGEEIELN